MRYIKLFESFSTDGESKSLSEIDTICQKFGITNYTVNSDGSVDVDGNVIIGNKGLTKLPLMFGRVSGSFWCSNNELTSLEGCPTEVGGNFYCNNNQLNSLEGGPKEISGYFICEKNPIYEVYKLFPDYKSFMYSLDYNYLRGTSIVRSRFQEALDELDIELPESISGYKYI